MKCKKCKKDVKAIAKLGKAIILDCGHVVIPK